jgi:hypothetical protein
MPIIGEYEYMKFVQILSTKIMKLDIVVNPKKNTSLLDITFQTTFFIQVSLFVFSYKLEPSLFRNRKADPR